MSYVDEVYENVVAKNPNEPEFHQAVKEVLDSLRPLGDADISMLTTEYCMKVLCLARLLVPKADIRCAAGREVYFKGEEKKLLSVVDSIFASGYLTEGGQGIEDTLKTITDAGFTYEIESA